MMPIQGSWDEVMAQKRATGKKIIARSPPNRKFPGEDTIKKNAETMSIEEISNKYSVSESTVVNWFKRCKIRVSRAKKKSGLMWNPDAPLMQEWAKLRISSSSLGINGWFRRLPF